MLLRMQTKIQYGGSESGKTVLENISITGGWRQILHKPISSTLPIYRQQHRSRQQQHSSTRKTIGDRKSPTTRKHGGEILVLLSAYRESRYAGATSALDKLQVSPACKCRCLLLCQLAEPVFARRVAPFLYFYTVFPQSSYIQSTLLHTFCPNVAHSGNTSHSLGYKIDTK